MSVEAFLISALVEEGSVKKAYQADINADDFELHDEEFLWLIERAELKQPISKREFRQKFPDFDLVRTDEPIGDLIYSLKREKKFIALSSAVDELLGGDDPLDVFNAEEKFEQFVDALSPVMRHSSVHTPLHALKVEWEKIYDRMKVLSSLRDNGEIPGIQTGLEHLDLHWGGLQPETAYLVLGRPGDAKSFFLAQLAVEAAWKGYRAAVFSPEMSEHQHDCRFHTLLSAKPEVQSALGLKEAFRNRALISGQGFNMKNFKRFLQWIESELPGEILLFTQKYRREKMTTNYIGSIAEAAGADLVIVDPLYKLRPPRRRGTRWEELGEITDTLVDLAHTLNIPIVMSNQANRALISQKGDAPDMGSSFGSDTPVQEADAVIGVKHYSEERLLKFRCSKNRYGERFSFSAQFIPNRGIINDVTPLRADHARGFDPEKLTKLVEGEDDGNR